HPLIPRLDSRRGFRRGPDSFQTFSAPLHRAPPQEPQANHEHSPSGTASSTDPDAIGLQRAVRVLSERGGIEVGHINGPDVAGTVSAHYRRIGGDGSASGEPVFAE